MGIFDALFGRKRNQQPETQTYRRADEDERYELSDEEALQRYRTMVQTAPPETVERAHAEAFARLSPDQRADVQRTLSGELAPGERAAFTGSDPQSLGRMATRVEMRRPGTMERLFGQRGMGGMGGMGGMLAGSIFGALVAGFVGSMAAQAFMEGFGVEEFAGADLGEMAFGQEFAETADTFGDFGGDGEF